MVIEHFDAEGLPQPEGYRHASLSTGNRVVRIAGQVGVDAQGDGVGNPGDYTAQAEQALANALRAFAAAGAAPSDIAHLTYYVVGLTEEVAHQVNKGLGRTVRRFAFAPVPATMVGITGLMRGDLLIEVDGIAVIDDPVDLDGRDPVGAGR